MKTLTVGRSDKNHIVLNDKFVSRSHARIVIDDNGLITIQDLDSSNGTFVNGMKVKDAILKHGDIVKCGSSFLNWQQYIGGHQSLRVNSPGPDETLKDRSKSPLIQYGIPSLQQDSSLQAFRNKKNEGALKGGKRYRGLLLLVLLAGAFVIGFLVLSSTNKLPEAAMTALLSNDKFARPVFISVPWPDKQTSYENIVNNPVVYDYGFLPTVTVEINSHRELNSFSKPLLNYLTKSGYLDIREASRTKIDRYGQNSRSYSFALYKPAAQPYLTRFTNTDWEYGMKAATRKFQQVTYENNFRQTIEGIEYKVYSVKFSYVLQPVLLGLEGIANRSHSGEAQLYESKKDGKWKIMNLKLSDNGQSEVENFIDSLK